MKRYGKLASAIVLFAAVTMLTACGNSVTPEMEQIAVEMDGQIVKSKVTSANATAKALMQFTNAYITECVSRGGKEWESGAITISCADGNCTVSGYDVDACKPKSMDKTFAQMLREDFAITDSCFAKIYINNTGMANAAVFTSETSDLTESDCPDEQAFKDGFWKWNGKTEGVSPSGAVIGTAPILSLKQ